MDYEFHVGDYVETNDGTIGYISSVLVTGDAWWMCTSGGCRHLRDGHRQ